MTIEEVREYYLNIVKDLDKNFPEVFESKHFTSKAVDWVQKEYCLYVEYGSEKVSFVPICGDFDYVLKFNLYGKYSSCIDEVILYEKAQQDGVSFCFAAAYEGFSYDGIDFTIMEYACPNEDSVYTLSESGEDDERGECEICWDAFINAWGEDAMDEVGDFVDRWDIGDLHVLNCGWTNSGELKFFDYSGYLVRRPEFHGGVA
jgi:hypothetical protein